MIWLWDLAAIVLGPVAGSFLGLISMRLPEDKTVVAGRSRLAAPTLEESELGDLPDAPTGSTGAVPVFDQDQ